jgi:tetratricopeptide (TPR) repeat protein
VKVKVNVHIEPRHRALLPTFRLIRSLRSTFTFTLTFTLTFTFILMNRALNLHPHFHLPPGLLGVALLAWSLTGAIRARAADAGTEATPLVAAKRLFGDGRYPEAHAAFEKIAMGEPQNAEVLFYLGWIAFRLNQPEESVKFLEKATALDANKSLYFHVLGDAYGASAQRASLFYKLGLAKKCLAAYDSGVEVDPNNVEVRIARYNYYRGAPAFIGGGADKAAAELAEIRKRDPVQADTLLVEKQIAEKEYDRAFATIDGVLRRQPENMVALYQLGKLAAIARTQLDRGEASLRRYLAHAPASQEPPLSAACWRLGMICEQKGDKLAARVEYEAALKLDPGFTDARESLKKLQ